MKRRPLPSLAQSRQRYADARQRGKPKLTEDPEFRRRADLYFKVERSLRLASQDGSASVAKWSARMQEARDSVNEYRRQHFQGSRAATQHIIREALRRARP